MTNGESGNIGNGKNVQTKPSRKSTCWTLIRFLRIPVVFATRYPGTSYPFGTSTEAYGNVNEGGSAAPPLAQRILSELEFLCYLCSEWACSYIVRWWTEPSVTVHEYNSKNLFTLYTLHSTHVVNEFPIPHTYLFFEEFLFSIDWFI